MTTIRHIINIKKNYEEGNKIASPKEAVVWMMQDIVKALMDIKQTSLNKVDYNKRVDMLADELLKDL